MNKTLVLVLMCLIALGMAPEISRAAVYHVSPTGNASWSSCTNIAAPCSWQTAMANAVADDVVYFHGGTYNVESSCGAWGSIAMTPAHTGTLGHYITFIAYPGETPVINGCVADPSGAAFGAINVDYIIWDGFSGRMVPHPATAWLFLFWNSTGSIVRNCNFTGVPYEGTSNNAPVDIHNSSDNEIHNNFFHDCTGTLDLNINTSGVRLFGARNAKIHHNIFYNVINGVLQTHGPNVDSEIYKNFFYITGGAGINLDEQYPSSGGLKIYENVLLNASQGIALEGSSDTATVNDYQIFNNAIYGAQEGIGLSSYTRSTSIWNNIIVDSSGDFLRSYAGVALPSYSNYNDFNGGGYWNLSWNYIYSLTDWTSQTNMDSNSVLTDPGFLDPGGLNASDYKRSSYPTNGRGGLYAPVMGAYITGNERIGYLPPPGRVREWGTAAGAPVISIPPVSTSVMEGQTATFSVSATGDAPLSYQWKRNGANVGSNSPTFTTTPTTMDDNGAGFSVVVSNSVGQTESAVAILTVLPSGSAPVITTQPVNISVMEGQTATFTVTATGDAPLAYQWKRNGSNVGSNSPSYTTGATTMNDNGAGFSVVVSNSVGQVESNEAILTVLPNSGAPVITTQPVNTSVLVGQTATFSVSATGDAPLSYQWKRNGSNVGTNSPTFTTGPTTMSDNGAGFSVVVSNSVGQVESNGAILTVLPTGTARIAYLHHSTGGNIWDGGVPEYFDAYNTNIGTNYQITDIWYPLSVVDPLCTDPNDLTNCYPWHNYPYDYWNLWVNHTGTSQDRRELNLDQIATNYDVIMFKHCFPVSYINPDSAVTPSVSSDIRTIANYQLQYEALKTRMKQFPDKKFILWTGAAQVAAAIEIEYAQRAQTFFNWVKTTWDEQGDNIFIFDFYTLETEGGLFMKDEYSDNPTYDSHPNAAFSATVAPYISQRIIDAIEGRGDTGSITGH